MERQLVLAILSAFAAGCGIAETRETDRTILTNVNIVDVSNGTSAPGEISMLGERIERVALKPSEVAVAGRRLDLHGQYVMPGLIDTHTHMLRAGSCGRDEKIAWDNAAQIPLNFGVALAHGETTVVDLGGPLYGVVALRDKFRTADTPTPRYFVAGPVLTAQNGYPLDWAPRDLVESMDVAWEIGSPEAGRAAIRRLKKARVDVVKIAVMDISYNEKPLPIMSLETLTAIVSEAHRLRLRVFIHAHTNEGYRRGIAAGADVIAHSTFEALPDDIIAAAAAAKVIVVPTLWVFASFQVAMHNEKLLAELQNQLQPALFANLADFDRRMKLNTVDVPDDFLPGLKHARLDFAMGNARENLRKLKAAGVPIAFGTDTSFCYALHGSAVPELLQMKLAGLTTAEVLAAATLNSARALGRNDLGSLRAGAYADLIVLRKNPLEDLETLRDPSLVILGGKTVHSPEVRADHAPGITQVLGVLATIVRSIYGPH